VIEKKFLVLTDSLFFKGKSVQDGVFAQGRGVAVPGETSLCAKVLFAWVQWSCSWTVFGRHLEPCRSSERIGMLGSVIQMYTVLMATFDRVSIFWPRERSRLGPPRASHASASACHTELIM
jgi:hypothetical protein